MIAWFTKDGAPTPVKFRFEDDEGSFSVIKVDKILFKDIEKSGGISTIIYKCRSIIRNAEATYQLKYETSTMKWILCKI